MILTNIFSMVMIILSGFITIIFFNSIYEKRRNIEIIILLTLFKNIVEAFMYLFKIPLLNLITFLIGNYYIVKISYEGTRLRTLLGLIFLCFVMMISEFFAILIFHICFDINVESILNVDGLSMYAIIYGILSKSLNLIIVIIAKMIILRKNDSILYDNTYFFFLGTPISAITLMLGITYIVNKLNTLESIVIIISIIPVLIAEFASYIVYDYIIEKNRNIEMLKNSLFENELKLKEFDLYETRYKYSRRIIHDIKKHLNMIKNLGYGSDAANNYVNELLSVLNAKMYTTNNVLNIILNEKCRECKDKDIIFSINIGTNAINIICESDIVIIFCNLIENAIESCMRSSNRYISLDVCLLNDSFLVINMTNSCDNAPLIKGNKLISSKKYANTHGIGMVNVEKAINKYNGNMEYSYDKNNKTFSITILIAKV